MRDTKSNRCYGSLKYIVKNIFYLEKRWYMKRTALSFKNLGLQEYGMYWEKCYCSMVDFFVIFG